MPLFYQVGTGVGILTTSGTTNTELPMLYVKPGVNSVSISSCRVVGRGNALTTLNGIALAYKNWTTATTLNAGTSITPAPADPLRSPAATSTAGSAVGGALTVGTGGGTYVGPSFGCSATGPGGWTAETPDGYLFQKGGGAGSIDLNSVATAVSLTFTASESIVE